MCMQETGKHKRRLRKMKLQKDYLTVRVPFFRIRRTKNKSGITQKLPFANDMETGNAVNETKVGDVVVTRDCLDVGLVGCVENGHLYNIYGRPAFNDDRHIPQYGGIHHCQWYNTGICMQKDEWEELAEKCGNADGWYEYWQKRIEKTR